LQQLLHDPAEKIRRYAVAALPKLGAGGSEEAELLSLLQTSTVERERKFIGDALAKIGGSETLHTIQQTPGKSLPPILQKVRANVARSESPSEVCLERQLTSFEGLRIHLRGRSGLEQIVRQESRRSWANAASSGCWRCTADSWQSLRRPPSRSRISMRCVVSARSAFVLAKLNGEAHAQPAGSVAGGDYLTRSRARFCRRLPTAPFDTGWSLSAEDISAVRCGRWCNVPSHSARKF
jgi:hypothetical protein